ncbi:triose-phosphate transporter (TPT), GDP-Mannose:GMP Antiporter (GMA) Family [Trachipleistophora hominis]|uniref:GDP-mannose transporter n=1 Tax=Trachipleistophora hominis TaxID=72359 RepID=L7JVQ2_TRAHO|nr:triose-phosphate transporter (TPT), GDP-Mannose:GMP Antiporter (GMA) Family [Trachipleistophora hominis]
MVKSSSPIFILLSSFVLNNEPVSFLTFFIIFLIGLGTFLITFSHDTLNLPQVLPILFASLVSGIRWSLIQRYLTKTSIFTFIATINLNISIILLIMAIYFEGLPVLNMHSFVLIVVLSVISFFLVWCEYTILKCFSCVFLCVLGIVKEMSVVVLSVYVGKVRLEGVNWIGLVLSVCGLMMYGMRK